MALEEFLCRLCIWVMLVVDPSVHCRDMIFFSFFFGVFSA
jgi:hypothetical protein